MAVLMQNGDFSRFQTLWYDDIAALLAFNLLVFSPDLLVNPVTYPEIITSDSTYTVG